MRHLLLVLSLFFSGSLLANETWYGYCIAEKNEVRYCLSPIEKTDSMKARCLAFAQDVGANGYEIQYGTDLDVLTAEMPDHCDEVKGPDVGDIYSCKYSKLCKNGAHHVSPLENRVFAKSKVLAIDRCFANNSAKLTQKLKELSAADCFLKVVVEKIH